MLALIFGIDLQLMFYYPSVTKGMKVATLKLRTLSSKMGYLTDLIDRWLNKTIHISISLVVVDNSCFHEGPCIWKFREQ